MNYQIRPLESADKGYVLASWRESVKQSPEWSRCPWHYVKATIGVEMHKLIDDPTTKLLGAYNEEDKLLGWICVTPGKRVHTLHWVQVKFELADKELRRRGLMLALIDAAELGSRFVYTLRARRAREALPDGSHSKSLDEVLVVALQERGIAASFVPLKEWLK